MCSAANCHLLSLKSPQLTWGSSAICFVLKLLQLASSFAEWVSECVCAAGWNKEALGLGLRLALGLLPGDIFFHFHHKKPCQGRIWVRRGFVVETLESHRPRRPKRTVPASRAALAWQFSSDDFWYFSDYSPLVLAKGGWILFSCLVIDTNGIDFTILDFIIHLVLLVRKTFIWFLYFLCVSLALIMYVEPTKPKGTVKFPSKCKSTHFHPLQLCDY